MLWSFLNSLQDSNFQYFVLKFKNTLMMDSQKEKSWSKDINVLKLCRYTKVYMPPRHLQHCNSLLLHPTAHSASVFLILLKIKVRSCYSWAHNPSTASYLLLIQATIIIMAYKASLIWLYDFWLHLIFPSHLWTPSAPGCFSLWQ